ncbi:alpha-L-fucosidase [Galbibacter mesophilus]|uniref:alpha-L-fucosidase n=1 Tax=Galbibacter mesophilus TaxID=379069 RepID=UPI00191D6BDB|nr:alpha-L-fucosidase [Galbibacter mesophilus]MCM5664340.1 alpha-L-fucosidase [Galbibacter mesophilus]
MTILFSVSVAWAQNYSPSKENLEKREWFNDARFGIMIHWGLYSMLAGGGENAPSEWILRNKNIPPKAYRKLMDFFNPSQFSASEWVDVVKNSGAGYLNFVVKHGDGFLLYNSNTSNFKVTNTPYGKDVLEEIKKACNAKGVKLILHYYQMDLADENYLAAKVDVKFKDEQWQNYLETQNKQVNELMSNYGPIDGLWFNGWWDIGNKRDWQLEKTYDIVHNNQSSTLITNNHHISLQDGEDYELYYKKFPIDKVSKRPRETFFSISSSWGYNLVADDYLTSEEIITSIIKAAAHNSNFTLNIGPMPNGRIAPEIVKTLKEVGAWMEKYGSIIKGSRAVDWPSNEFLSFVMNHGKVYMFVSKDFQQEITLPTGVPVQKIKSAMRFGEDIKLAIQKRGKSWVFKDTEPIRKGTIYEINIQ